MQVYDNIACESAPVADSHLANKAYVDAAVANGAGTASVSGDSVVSIPAHSLISCEIEPTEDSHLVNKAYVDSAVANAVPATPIEEPAALGRVVVVNTLSDAATHTGTSLRDAITAAANWANTLIKFSVSGTITLEQGEIEISGYVRIDGENKITISGGNASRVFLLNDATYMPVLKLYNLTITGGNGVGSVNSQQSGGAIYVNGVFYARRVTFSGNHISGATTGTEGGAIYLAANGRVYLKNCDFVNNSVTSAGATARGGAIMANSNHLVIEGCSFTENSSVGAEFGYGGALMVATSQICDCIFTGNTVSGSTRRYGGAIYYSNGFGDLKNCEFVNNSVTNDFTACYGGAVFCLPSFYVRIDGCVFRGNTAMYGAALNLYGAVKYGRAHNVIHCIFDNNLTNGRGAAIYIYYASATIEDCEFNNHANVASGVIYAYGYTDKLYVVTINRCKFVGNSSSTNTTGLVYCANLSQVYLYNTVFTANSFTATSGNHKCVYTTGSSNAFIYNCTFTNNTNKGGAFYAAGGGVEIYNSVEYGNGSASGKGTSPTVNAAKFLSDQSASVGRDIAYDSTKPLFAADGYTPVANSQVIDAGDNTYAVTEYDLPGKARVSGTKVDLGAVEYQSA